MLRLLIFGLLCGLADVLAATDVVVSKNGSYASSPTLYGIMYEDINYSGDGGIYAELVRNRAFQQVVPGTAESLAGWSSVGNSSISVVNDTAPLSAALPNSLKVSSPSVRVAGSVGVANSGYWGMAINTSHSYNASFFAKSTSPLMTSITVSLVNLDGTVLGSSIAVPSGALSHNWTEFKTVISPTVAPSSANNSLQISFDATAAAGQEVFFSLVSLFPPTFKDVPNGLRIDLAETLLSMDPSFFRFPGGNNLEGNSVASRWKWNETVGPLMDRPGRLGVWGYVNTDGQGLMEYLDLCEAFDVEPYMAVYAGYSLNGEVILAEDFQWVWEEAIKQIQFAIGDAETNAYAALRAKYGHPEPYKLTKIEVGNEDQFALGSYTAYRYPYLVGNMTAVFPDLQYMASNGQNDLGASSQSTANLAPSPALYDIHIYNTPEWFIKHEDYYDPSNWPRSETDPKVFQGEYAVTSTNVSCLFGSPDCGRFQFPQLVGAIAEAAFLAGMERNSDLIFATAYAPVLQNLNSFRLGSLQWTPDLISFDAETVIKSVSYYVQQMFAINKGDTILPVTPTRAPPVYYVASQNDGAVFIKAVNTGSANETLAIAFDGVAVGSSGNATMITSTDLNAANTPERPFAVVPEYSTFIVSDAFKYTLPPYSVVVLVIAV